MDSVEALLGNEEWATWTSSWGLLGPDKSSQQDSQGLDESHPCLRKWDGPGAEEMEGLCRGRAWETCSFRGHSRDRHAVIITIEWRPGNDECYGEHSSILISIQGIICSGKEVNFLVFLSLYFFSIKVSIILTQRDQVFVFMSPIPDIIFKYKDFLLGCSRRNDACCGSSHSF